MESCDWYSCVGSLSVIIMDWNAIFSFEFLVPVAFSDESLHSPITNVQKKSRYIEH
jgi:hypothetical protein